MCVIVAAALVASAFGLPGGSGGAASAATTGQSTSRSAASKSSVRSAPRTSFARDQKFFTEVTEADPTLATYERQQGGVALQALLTAGSAFCVLLKQGGGIDRALVGVAEGVRDTQSETKFPLSVTSLNTVEAVSLLTLCPSEQRLVPASVRSKIRTLRAELAKQGKQKG